MSKATNLTGQKFNRLTVIEQDKSSIKRTKWICRCDCGKISSVRTESLLSGATKSCGCYHKEMVTGRKDLTGKRFGRLIVIGIDENERYSWKCKCDCGNEISVYVGHLQAKRGTKSCGCFLKETSVKNAKYINYKHGLYENRFYRVWEGIKQRCYNKNSSHYHCYGGRGITLWKDWIDNPVAFIEYIIKLENSQNRKYSLDRIDNNGNYEPGNLRWATRATQMRNTRSTKLSKEDVLEIRRKYNKGETQASLAREFGVKSQSIHLIVHNRSWIL